MRKRIVGNKSSNFIKRIARLEKQVRKLVEILIKKGIIIDEDVNHG